MGFGKRYRINSPQVISETIDGETIIINLESGYYFSLNSSGGEIWNDLRALQPVEKISQAIASRYGLPQSESEAQVGEFLNLLLQEQLILPADEANPPANARPAENQPPATQGIFEKPLLHKYEDMQDLLLLDPIHDVDEMGWPKSNAS